MLSVKICLWMLLPFLLYFGNWKKGLGTFFMLDSTGRLVVFTHKTRRLIMVGTQIRQFFLSRFKAM